MIHFQSKREVGDVIYYLVKYKDYKKLWWEPEENLTGCAEIVENFYLEEKVVWLEMASYDDCHFEK